MKWIKLPFIFIWRIWYYILVAFPIVLMLPFLAITAAREKWYPQFFFFARIWAYIILYGMGFIPKFYYRDRIEKGKSYMLVANHTSMTDIMMMLILTKTPFVFVGKKELSKLPLFGYFYKRVCIMVDRSDPRSRSAVYRRAQARLNTGVGICIFPEGGVPTQEGVVLDSFKNGAFRLAIEHQIDILPVTLPDNRKRFPFWFFQGSPGKMRAHVHEPVASTGMDLKDVSRFRESVRDTILNQLDTMQ